MPQNQKISNKFHTNQQLKPNSKLRYLKNIVQFESGESKMQTPSKSGGSKMHTPRLPIVRYRLTFLFFKN